MALLKQINLIQKSSNEDSLAATYNGCAETSFIDSGNIYEFIFQDENLIGNNGNQLLLAFQLKLRLHIEIEYNYILIVS